MTGKLSIVATPIGALDDITLRALRVLREADVVLAEDTRRTRVLLEHHGIRTRLASYHAHSSDSHEASLLDQLAEGRHFALVTDAGTPLVSDPGGTLVNAARDRGITIEACPGPSAVLTALALAGLRCDDFRFVGFLPRSGRRRRARLEEIASGSSTTVFFEAPSRVRATLEELASSLEPDRRIAMARELTKVHEQVIRGSVAEVLAALPDPVLGEVTLVVEGRPEDEALALDEGALDERIRAMLSSGVSAKAVAKALAEAAGIPSRELYAKVVALKHGGG